MRYLGRMQQLPAAKELQLMQQQVPATSSSRRQVGVGLQGVQRAKTMQTGSRAWSKEGPALPQQIHPVFHQRRCHQQQQMLAAAQQQQAAAVSSPFHLRLLLREPAT